MLVKTNLEERPFAKSIQALRKNELELLLSFKSKKEISEKTRKALWLIFDHGWSITFAARNADVSYRHVSNAEKKLLAMHHDIMKLYGKY